MMEDVIGRILMRRVGAVVSGRGEPVVDIVEVLVIDHAIVIHICVIANRGPVMVETRDHVIEIRAVDRTVVIGVDRELSACGRVFGAARRELHGHQETEQRTQLSRHPDECPQRPGPSLDIARNRTSHCGRRSGEQRPHLYPVRSWIDETRHGHAMCSSSPSPSSLRKVRGMARATATSRLT